MQQAAALLWLLAAGAGVDTLRYSHSRARQLFSLSGEDSGYTADTRSYFYHAVSSYCTVQHNFDSHSKIFEYFNILGSFSQIVEQNYEQKWQKADTQMAENGKRHWKVWIVLHADPCSELHKYEVLVPLYSLQSAELGHDPD